MTNFGDSYVPGAKKEELLEELKADDDDADDLLWTEENFDE